MPTSVNPIDVLVALKKRLDALKTKVNELKAQMAACSVTTTTPPTADGTGLPAFVVLDAKPETEYRNYIYFYPKGQ